MSLLYIIKFDDDFKAIKSLRQSAAPDPSATFGDRRPLRQS
jgi:hypothetical protein